jgi:hypothetical protein
MNKHDENASGSKDMMGLAKAMKKVIAKKN